MGIDERRSDLPTSAQGCVSGVGATHIHPSWRSFDGIPLTPVPPDRYEMTFTDVPTGTRVSFRINDQNSCDENPTGAVTRTSSPTAFAWFRTRRRPGTETSLAMR